MHNSSSLHFFSALFSAHACMSLACSFKSTCLELVIKLKLKRIFFFCFSFISNQNKWTTMSCSIWFTSRNWRSNAICILVYSFSNLIESHLCFRNYSTLDFENMCEWIQIQWNTSFDWLARIRYFKTNSAACKSSLKVKLNTLFIDSIMTKVSMNFYSSQSCEKSQKNTYLTASNEL